MVIAEALNERKTLFKAARELTAQIAADAVVEKRDPDATAEDIAALLTRLESALTEAAALTIAINQANNHEMVTVGGKTTTLMEAIALRDQLTLLHASRVEILNGLDEALGKRRGRYIGMYGRKTKDDVKEVSLIDRDAFRKENDAIAEQRRLLDIEIQKVNWSAEL